MKVNKTYRSLLDKSIGSMLSAIEIYNKPAFHNREEVFAILAVNSWELLLKAQWLRLNRFNIRSIYELQPAKNKNGQNSKVKKVIVNNRCGNPKTLSINTIMDNLRQRGLLKDNLSDNIESLIELRDNSIHFINPDSISKQVQELGFACIKNYMAIIKEWKVEIDLSSYNFYLMPLAYVDEKKIVTGTLTNETMNYINLVKEKVNHMDDTDLEYAVAISIDVEFKKGNTFDSIGVNYAPDGIKVSLSEEDFKKRFPWRWNYVIKKCCDRYTDFKQNAAMHAIFNEIKENPKLSHERRLYPNREKPSTVFYSSNVLKEFDKHYTKK